MRTALRGIAVLAVAVMSSTPATAHHSNPLYFDMTKAITLEGLILRVEWINPHALIFLQSKNEKGELETWIIQGTSPVNFARKPELKERLKAGIWVAARVFPPRNPLYLDDTQTVLLTRPDNPKTSSRIVGGGQIRLSNGDVLAFGGGPTFQVQSRPHPHGVAAGDFDGDRHVDLAIESWQEDAVLMFKGNGKAGFTMAPMRLTVGRTPYWKLRAADLNGDGKADIVTGNWESGDVSVVFSR